MIINYKATILWFQNQIMVCVRNALNKISTLVVELNLATGAL